MGDLPSNSLGLDPLTDSWYTTIGGDAMMSTPCSFLILYSVISRWSSPIPDIRCSPVSLLISMFSEGSALAMTLRTSTSLGRSAMFLASMALVMTGSE